MGRDTKPLAEQAAEKLVNYIVDNDLKPSDKIPNEFELAQLLEVGRSTIREAIKLLISKNILEIKRGSGTFVSEKHGIVEDPLGLMFVKDRKKLAMDLLDIRFMLEPKIAAMAAKNATKEQIEELQQQCNKVAELFEQGVNHLEEDVKLHKMIAACSGNSVVENLIPIINSSVILSGNITFRKLKRETIETHQKIVDAIAIHDEDGAKYAMCMHLYYNRQVIMNLEMLPENEEHIQPEEV